MLVNSIVSMPAEFTPIMMMIKIDSSTSYKLTMMKSVSAFPGFFSVENVKIAANSSWKQMHSFSILSLSSVIFWDQVGTLKRFRWSKMFEW
jgi:hypothetical protein